MRLPESRRVLLLGLDTPLLQKAVTKSGILHSLIQFRAATGYVFVHDVRPREIALDGNGTVAMHLHRVVKCGYGCATSFYCLDLQQYREKRIRSNRISCHG